MNSKINWPGRFCFSLYVSIIFLLNPNEYDYIQQNLSVFNPMYYLEFIKMD